jgi:transketolase
MTLNQRSKQVRRDIFALSAANGGYHYGGTFSCVEILIALYDHILQAGDRFILSKGHACWGFYVLLQERGFSPSLEGHPHLDLANGVHWTTGSEGHGFPAGVGMALARKMQNVPGKVYVVVGDGECQEGTTWESLMLAVRYKLSNLVVIMDANGIQGSDFVNNILPVKNIVAVAARAAGWTIDIVDGHNIESLKESLSKDYSDPHFVIANTVKGKGVSFMENQPSWHANWPNMDLIKKALEELQ